MNIFSKIKKRIADNINADSFIKMKRLWINYVLPQWKLLAVSALFMVIFGVLEAASIKLLEPVFDKVFIDKNKEVLTWIAIQIVILFAAKGVAYYVQSVSMSTLGVNFIKKMQVDLYDKIVIQDLEFFHNNNLGNLLTYFVSDLNAVRESILKGVTTLCKDTCSVFFLVILMFWKCFDMAIVVFLLFPIAFYPIVYFGKKMKRIFSNQQIHSGNLYAILTQSFQGIKIVKSYNMEEVESQKAKNNTDILSDIQIKMAKNNNILSPLMEFFGGTAAAGTLVYGGYRIMHGSLTTGSFMVFLFAIVAAYKPMKSLANLNMCLQMGVVAANRIFAVMDQNPAIVDNPAAKVFRATRGIIKVDNVRFGYVPGFEILHGINLEVREGEKVAIVGAAGSGKSTLISLILRFYDVQNGSIEIDGEDVRDVTIKSLRDNIAFVSQDAVLFDDTIKKNILMGRPGATDEEIIEASKNAAAHNFIINQDRKYDTIVGERGSNLSGGQKQMISIARAMLKNAPILLLDEATSSLDSQSEKMVQEGLEKLIKGRTSIVIAHR
ncbi:MAG: ABC transporter ATP-binding protein/permease, partial [Endomicrobium sp.]|nr:ABC transporter ATP-binding protein/permease [Endomicrobium sp.]